MLKLLQKKHLIGGLFFLTFLTFLFFFLIDSPLLFCFYFSLQEVNLNTQAISVWVSLCHTFQGKAFKVEGISKLDPKLLKRLHPETVFKETELQACPFGSACAREEKYSDNKSLYQWLKNSESKPPYQSGLTEDLGIPGKDML